LDYVAAVQEELDSGHYENSESVVQWIAWAKDYADRLDPLREGLPLLLQFDDFNSWEL